MTEQAAEQEAPWFCVRTKPHNEPRVAAYINTLAGAEAYAPRLRYRKITRRGPVWFIEALFPTYVFARFDLADQFKTIAYARGVRGLLRFGGVPATVPDAAVAAMRQELGAEGIKVFEDPLVQGDQAYVSEGPFQGLLVTVTQIMPSKDRVRILLEFLGRETEAIVDRRILESLHAHPFRG